MEDIDYIALPHFKTAHQSDKVPPIYVTGTAILMTLLGSLSGFVIAKKLNLHDALAHKILDANAGPVVETAPVSLSSPDRLVKELGEAVPYSSVTLYAKVSGYLQTILVDKGDVVKQGQVLATIYSPETHSKYAAALADRKNKQLLANRARALFAGGDITEEERDKAVANADMADATLAEINAQKDYTILTAPFDGVVTERFADPGSLVQDAAKAETGALPVVTVTQGQKLRVTTYINQKDAPLVRVGDPVLISLPEKREATYEATVSRKSGELDAKSRTMKVEVDLDNVDNSIVPGSLVDVSIRVKSPQTLQVPSPALVVRNGEYFVALVDKNENIHYQKIVAVPDDGATVDILSGVTEGDMVALNVGDNMIEGQHIQVADQND